MIWDRLNAFLDSLPRTRVGRAHRPVPAFRSCGVIGFYLALLVLFAGGLLTGRSLMVLALLALVSGLSFFGYTYLRKWVTGREELVLLEHVWFALACNAATLRLFDLPVLAYLDLVAVALCPFLAMGRLGCTLVGCCHGLPSTLGITYPEECAADGFPRHWVGVRLFPVPAIEGVGLGIIGGSGLWCLPNAEPGRVFAWFLLAYAIMRFGLEGIRGDVRPQLLGLSQARWMAMAEVALALHLTPSGLGRLSIGVSAALFLTLIGCLIYRWRRDPTRRILSVDHLREVERACRDIARTVASDSRDGAPATSTSRGVTLAVSECPGSPQGTFHVSLALPVAEADLALLCELAVRAFPTLDESSLMLSQGRILHFAVPPGEPLATAGAAIESPESLASARARARGVYGDLLRRMAGDAVRPGGSENLPVHGEGDLGEATEPENVRHEPLPWYMVQRSPDPHR